MANKEKGEKSFKALGKDWVLVYTTNSLCEMEDKSGKGAPELFNDGKITSMRYLLWGALVERHEDITLRECGNIIDELGMEGLGKIVGSVFELAFPDDVEPDGDADVGKIKAKA
ncbi:hypothetical protein [Lentilitoribacter sp. EG35]|uniref:hypothetical protein n=1 Tax=Lentilitoribacter sp. EG35 TaxID=3234192 RepID=UPI0034615A10